MECVHKYQRTCNDNNTKPRATLKSDFSMFYAGLREWWM